jgi:hypothetical protein
VDPAWDPRQHETQEQFKARVMSDLPEHNPNPISEGRAGPLSHWARFRTSQVCPKDLPRHRLEVRQTHPKRPSTAGVIPGVAPAQSREEKPHVRHEAARVY